MERVLELIRAYAPQEIPAGAITLSEPEVAYTRGNTLVQVQGTMDTGTYLDFPFHYNRIDLDARGARSMVFNGELTTHDLLPRLNVTPIVTYGLKAGSGTVMKQALLLPADIVNQPLQLVPGENTVWLLATPGSYLYTGKLIVKITA